MMTTHTATKEINTSQVIPIITDLLKFGTNGERSEPLNLERESEEEIDCSFVLGYN